MIGRLFFDLETIPAEEKHHDYLSLRWANLKDRGVPNLPDTPEEFIDRTALSGDFGRIACMAWAIDGEEPAAMSHSEPFILKQFWKLASETKLFVGHNILSFDLPFIIKRSVVHRIKPSKYIYLGKFKKDPVYDTMEEWSNWGRERTPLDALTRLLGLPSPKDGGMDGSQVGEAWKAGKKKEIETYCKADVDAVREVYRRLTFAPKPTPGKEVKKK